MSLLMAAAVAIGISGVGGANLAPQAAPARPADPAGTAVARTWVVLLDDQKWRESWQATAGLFRSRVGQQQWATTINAVREPLGTPSARVVQAVIPATTLPGAPDGDYQIVQFRTDFAHKAGATETAVLAREGGTWKVAGYFIR